MSASGRPHDAAEILAGCPARTKPFALPADHGLLHGLSRPFLSLRPHPIHPFVMPSAVQQTVRSGRPGTE